MTLPHAIVRLFLVEQIYRAAEIHSGRKISSCIGQEGNRARQRQPSSSMNYASLYTKHMNIKRILTWLGFIVIVALIIVGLVAANQKTSSDDLRGSHTSARTGHFGRLDPRQSECAGHDSRVWRFPVPGLPGILSGRRTSLCRRFFDGENGLPRIPTASACRGDSCCKGSRSRWRSRQVLGACSLCFIQTAAIGKICLMPRASSMAMPKSSAST